MTAIETLLSMRDICVNQEWAGYLFALSQSTQLILLQGPRMSGSLSTRPLLSLEETKLAERIQRVLQEIGYRGKLIFKAHPAAFIDPNWIAKTDERQDALFKGVIPLAIIDRPTKGKISLAIIQSTSPFAHEVQSLLSEFDIPVFIGVINGDFSLLNDWLHLVLGKIGPRTPTKPIVNFSERWLMRISDRSLVRQIDPKLMNDLPPEVASILGDYCGEQRDKLLLFHEPALSALLAVDVATCREAAVNYDYLQKARLDLLVTGASPEYAPLMAIEFDGPHHEEKAGKLRDAKKERILTAAHIPLLRVSFHDAPPPSGGADLPADLPVRRTSSQKERILTGLINRCVTLLHMERVEIPARFKKHLEPVASCSRTVISETNRKTASIHIAEHDPVHIEKVAGQVLDALDEFHLDEAINQSADFQMREHNLDPRQDVTLKSTGVTLYGFQYHTDEAGGLYCSARVRRGENERVLQSPAVRYRCLGFDGFDFQAVLREELRLWLIDDVARRVAPETGDVLPFKA